MTDMEVLNSKLFQEPTLRLTPAWTGERQKSPLVYTAEGLITFRLALWVEGKELDSMPVISGQAGNQILLLSKDRVPKSGAPIGEGVYRVGDPDCEKTQGIAWASGSPGNYNARFPVHGDGIGPIWVGIHPHPLYLCYTSDFGFHADWNGQSGAPGTLGCTGILAYPGRLERLKQFVSWMVEHFPKRYVVDHGLGTVLHPHQGVDKAQPKVEEPATKTKKFKIFFNQNGTTVYKDDVKVDATKELLNLTLSGGKLSARDGKYDIPGIASARVELVYKTRKA